MKMTSLESFPEDVILHIASLVVPHAHLYPLFVSSKRVCSILKEGAQLICTKQLRRMLPLYAQETSEHDAPPMLVRREGSRQQSSVEQTTRVVRTIQNSIRHLHVLNAHPDQVQSLRGLESFVVHFSLSADVNLSGCIHFRQADVAVQLKHSKSSDHSHTWTVEPFQARRGDDSIVYIVFPLLQVNEHGQVHHDYLDELGVDGMSWIDSMFELSSSACTSPKRLYDVVTSETVHVPQYACLSRDKFTKDVRISNVELSTFVKAHFIHTTAISPNFLEGFDFDNNLDVLWQHMIGIERRVKHSTIFCCMYIRFIFFIVV